MTFWIDDAAIKALKEDKLVEWKKDRSYHKRSLVETAMFRYKKLLSPKLTLRDYNAQVGEALNKGLRLGMPIRQQIN